MDNKTHVSYELRHLYKKFGNNKFYTIKDVNLTAEGGDIYGFLGPNGAGKSTIIKSTVGLFTVDKGDILICGINAVNNPTSVKQIIGYVPDEYVLYEKLTGYEYLYSISKIYKIDKKTTKERIEYYAKYFSLTGAINNPIKTYSHGMKQKITIIATLIFEPKVWILDEPLTGLDPISVIQVKNMMRDYAKKGNIVFFSSHLIDIVKKLCTKVSVIKNGEIKKTIDLKNYNKSLSSEYLRIVNEE